MSRKGGAAAGQGCQAPVGPGGVANSKAPMLNIRSTSLPTRHTLTKVAAADDLSRSLSREQMKLVIMDDDMEYVDNTRNDINNPFTTPLPTSSCNSESSSFNARDEERAISNRFANDVVLGGSICNKSDNDAGQPSPVDLNFSTINAKETVGNAIIDDGQRIEINSNINGEEYQIITSTEAEPQREPLVVATGVDTTGRATLPAQDTRELYDTSSHVSMDPFTVEILGVEEQPVEGSPDETDDDEINSNTSIDYLYQEQTQQQQILLLTDSTQRKEDQTNSSLVTGSAALLVTAATSPIIAASTTSVEESSEIMESPSIASSITKRQRNVDYKHVHFTDEKSNTALTLSPTYTNPTNSNTYNRNTETNRSSILTNKSQKELMSDMTQWWGRSFQNKSGTRVGIIEKSELELDDDEIEENHCQHVVSPPPLLFSRLGEEQQRPTTEKVDDTNITSKRMHDMDAAAVVVVDIPSSVNDGTMETTTDSTIKSHVSHLIFCETKHGYCFGTVKNQCDALSLSICIFSLVLLVTIVLSIWACNSI
jgi:hypothetical protein